MINFGHVVQYVQQLLIGGAAACQRLSHGDHALAMTAQRRDSLIKLPDVPTDRVGQVARRVVQFVGDV
jgi:hypothetical protein